MFNRGSKPLTEIPDKPNFCIAVKKKKRNITQTLKIDFKTYPCPFPWK